MKDNKKVKLVNDCGGSNPLNYYLLKKKRQRKTLSKENYLFTKDNKQFILCKLWRLKKGAFLHLIDLRQLRFHL